jgi:hypothetical protein
VFGACSDEERNASYREMTSGVDVCSTNNPCLWQGGSTVHLGVEMQQRRRGIKEETMLWTGRHCEELGGAIQLAEALPA